MMSKLVLLTFLAPCFSWAEYHVDFTKDGVVIENQNGKIIVPIEKSDWEKGPDHMVNKALAYVKANKEKFTSK